MMMIVMIMKEIVTIKKDLRNDDNDTYNGFYILHKINHIDLVVVVFL